MKVSVISDLYLSQVINSSMFDLFYEINLLCDLMTDVGIVSLQPPLVC